MSTGPVMPCEVMSELAYIIWNLNAVVRQVSPLMPGAKNAVFNGMTTCWATALPAKAARHNAASENFFMSLRG